MAWRALTLMVVIFVVSVSSVPQDDVESRFISIRRIIDTIVSAGFPAEIHDVTTEDGYVLTMHRIPYGRSGPTAGQRPVVFLMHGIMGASSHFVSLGAEHSIAFNLADAGYDVWMGNARGNIYSRSHVSLNPDDSREKMDFFDFSWEEIALIDLPAMIDYALAHTGKQKLHYIGHSQGGTVFLVLNSMKTEYNEKIASAHLLAGVGYMANFPNAPLRALAAMTIPIYALALRTGLVEVSLDAVPIPLPNEGQKASDYCFRDIKHKEFCDLIGMDIILEERSVLALEMGGCSIKQVAHFGQNVKDKAFRRWDYGYFLNRVHYGSFTPPSFDLSKITIDVTMHYSLGDILLDERDVLAMAAVMPNTVTRRIARESFRHVDFIASADAKQLVNDFIIKRLDAAENICTCKTL